MTRARQCPALLIAAPASGQGKTTVTAALARLHARQGRRVRVFKVGPDFLEPMILARHLFRLFFDVAGFAKSSRRIALLALLIAGIVALALATTASVAAPVVLYPFG